MGSGSEMVVTALINAIDDPNRFVREKSILALGDIGSAASTSIPKLISLLKNPNDFARSAVITSLGNFGAAAQAAIPDLASIATNDFNSSMRQNSVETLGKIGKQAIPALLKILTNILTNQDTKLRLGVVKALRAIGSNADGTVPALIKALSDRDPDVRGNAAAALGEFGQDSLDTIPALIATLQNNDQCQIDKPNTLYFIGDIAAASLTKIGKESIPYLIKSLQSSDPSTRRRSGEALGKIGLDAVPDLITALKSQNLYLRQGATFALGTIQPSPPEVINQLQEIVMNEQNDRDLRRIAASSLEIQGIATQFFFNQNDSIAPNNAYCPVIRFDINSAFYQFNLYTGECLCFSISESIRASFAGLQEAFCNIFKFKCS
jgi:HEAT repeat protein